MKTEGLIVIGELSYPNASAPSNRVHLYCKAIKKGKGFPLVINLNSLANAEKPYHFLDRYDGIPFYYAQKSVSYEKNYFLRKIKKIKMHLNTCIVIGRLRKRYCLKVMYYNTTVFNEIIFSIFLRVNRIPIIRDCCELPLFIREEKKHRRVNNFFYKIRLKLNDEVIVISDFLYKYYSQYFIKEKMFQIPILVDMKRFENKLFPSGNSNKIITYIGSMGGGKDGLPDLIEAINILKNKFVNFRLQLVGKASVDEITHLKEKISKLNLDTYIQFLGAKNLSEIPKILLDSDFLVLARPDNLQAKAGFPTKLGEYLAAGKPVVITRTGEIPKYLADGESAYLANPGDPQGFAQKLLEALTDPSVDKIAQKGYLVANNNFNYQLYSKEMIRIINSNNCNN